MVDGGLYHGGFSEDTKILSLGAGEDISFDIELVNKFNCCVNIYDPTKRAIDHFSQIKRIMGKIISILYRSWFSAC